MGNVTNIIIFLLFVSFAAFILGAGANIEAGGSWEQYVSTEFTADLSLANLGLVLLIGGGILASAIFPNPYTTFATAFLVLYGFNKVITSLFTGLGAYYGIDSQITLLITTLLNLLLILGLIGWYRGNDL